MARRLLKRHGFDVCVGLILMGAILSFGHQAIQGESGLFVRVAVEKEGRRLTEELGRLSAERARLENLTLRLSDGYLDLDLLDERARDVLGYVRDDEVVIR